MSKTMCKSDKHKPVLKPAYKCRKCGELAAKEKHLCKPVKY